MVPTAATPGPRPTPVADAELRIRYAAYRQREAAKLVRLVPRAALRPLYRRAAEAETSSGSGPGQDPLDVLERFCESILPLPPFEVWSRDLAANPRAHLAELAGAARAPGADAPATLEARMVSFGGRSWQARLRSFRDGEVWRGYLAFEGDPGRTHRTAAIFCEADPLALRERFRSFEDEALTAFLRSSLP